MSSISGVGGNSAMMQGMGGMRGMQRPNPEKMAENLFSQLDVSGQGYIEKADLQSAFDNLSSSGTTSSGSTSNVDELFTALDTDSDGKVTQQEFSDTLKKIHDDLEQQFQEGRMQTAMQAGGMVGMGGMGGMPPPPPPEGADSGFTQDELSSQLEEIGSTDSRRSSLISSVIENFDAADTDGNGKVSFSEAMAYQQTTDGSASAQETGSTATSGAASSTETASEAKLMMQIMKLMSAYMSNNDAASTLSVSA